MNNPLQAQINDCLVNVISFICKNPLIYVSESDVHQLVVHELMKIPVLNPANELHNTECPIGNSVGKPSKVKYKTMLLHKEYGHTSSAYSRSDFVILNKSDVEQIDDPINLKRKKAWLVPDYIFEFGTEKSAGSVNTFKQHLNNDLKKTATAKVQGYLFHIHRNYFISTGGKKVKNTEKFEKYSDAIKEEIAEFKMQHPCKGSQFPKIIVIKISIGGIGRDITKEGKVQMLKDPYKNPKCRFTGIADKNIVSELQLLIFNNEPNNP